MKAAVYERTGPAAEVLRVVELPDPEPRRGEVRVRVHVSGVNPTDWKARGAPGRLPWPRKIPNQDGAGVVDRVGAGVDESRLDERVWLYHAAHGRPEGTAAEYVCVPDHQAVPLPDEVSFEQGAGLAIPYMTAHHCLFVGGDLRGRTVLVTGGAGAVGNAAIQLARRGGARVLTTVSSEEKAELARLAGADEVLNYRDDEFAARLAASVPEGIHRVVDVAFESNVASYTPVLAEHAHVASYASSPTPDVRLPLGALRAKNVTAHLVLVYGLPQAALDAAVHSIREALREGSLRPLPEHHFDLMEIVEAHEAVERGAVGKVLVHLR